LALVLVTAADNTRPPAGRRVTILECDLLSPPWDPEHCPPGVLWLMRLSGDGIERIRLFHPQPLAGWDSEPDRPDPPTRGRQLPFESAVARHRVTRSSGEY